MANKFFKKRTHVGVSISVNNIIELACINEITKTVERYASDNIKYNTAIREVMDYNELTEALEGLFAEAGLEPTECSVTLTIPNVHFGISTMDNPSDKLAIEETVQDDLSDLYIFKKNEPTIRTAVLPNSTIGYSAIQTKVIISLIDAFDSIGAELERIETSYSALIRALMYCDRFNKLVTKDNNSVVILVTQVSCTTFYLKGHTLADAIEEPLAVKSFSPEEVLSAVSKSASNAISKNRPDSLLIISEAEEVNAEEVASTLNFNGEIDFINKNVSLNDEFIEIDSNPDINTNLAAYMSIESAGSAISDYIESEIDLNFLPQARLPKPCVKVKGYEVDSIVFFGVCLALAAALAAALWGISKLVLDSQIQSMRNEKSEKDQSMAVFRDNAKKYDGKSESIFPTLQLITNNNKSIINAYNALSTEIPEDIYIKRFVTNSQGGIGILGESRSSNSVNNFIKGLKETNDTLMVTKLLLNNPELDPTISIPDGVTFEIKTSTVDVQFGTSILQKMQNATGGTDPNNPNNPNNPPVI